MKECGGYRYAFGGHEKDDDIKGTGNSYTTTFRQYDPRLGRWLSVDPIEQPRKSPYVGFGNYPVAFVDPEGGVIRFFDYDAGEIGTMTYTPEMSYNGNSEGLARAIELMNLIYETREGKIVIDHLVNSDRSFHVSAEDSPVEGASAGVYPNQRVNPEFPAGAKLVLARIGSTEMQAIYAANAMAEELYHSYQTEIYPSITGEAYIEVEAKLFAARISAELADIGHFWSTPATTFNASAPNSHMYFQVFSLQVENMGNGVWEPHLFDALVPIFHSSGSNLRGLYNDLDVTIPSGVELATFYDEVEFIQPVGRYQFLWILFSAVSKSSKLSRKHPLTDLLEVAVWIVTYQGIRIIQKLTNRVTETGIP